MRAVDIISKKRDGLALSQDEITWFIDAYSRENLPDYQAAAWLMAVYLRGMTREEIVNLTLAMAHSGEVLDLSAIVGGYAVDKHSSGGVGDKTTLVVLPLVAACGVPVAKMSGRALGFTGGTLDKMEAINGFKVDLSMADFERLAQTVGVVLAGQSQELAPADGKLYALRDVTATVSSLPLIASSIMSKKIAAGANGIVLDVKMGEGAFMEDLDSARELARMMAEIGADAGRDVVALISDMNQPLGQAVGNALEVAEAIQALQGGGPSDLREHCLEVASWMLRLAGQGEQWVNADGRRALLVEKLDGGAAFDIFRRMVEAQGGDVSMVDDVARLPQARLVETLKAETDGYVQQVAARGIADGAMQLGAGRERKADAIDPAVGVVVHVNVGDRVVAGTPMVTIHANDEKRLALCREVIQQALVISPDTVEPLPLFYDTIERPSIHRDQRA